MNGAMRPIATLVLGAALGLSAGLPTDARAQAPAEKGARVHTAALKVEGMTCASCSVAVRKALERLDGVKGAKVSVPEKRALVEYEPAAVTPQQLVDAVNRLGYRASLPASQGR